LWDPAGVFGSVIRLRPAAKKRSIPYGLEEAALPGEHMFKLIGFLTCFLAVVLFGAPLLLAQDEGLSQQFRDCLNDAGGTTERENCIGNEWALQDARLNDLYKKLMAVETEQGKQKLRDSQRAWIKYKEDWKNYINTVSDGDFLGDEYVSMFDLMTTVMQAENLQDMLNLHEYLKNND
jgi:uncharacterized protein YecT (DUF1311 family)